MKWFFLGAGALALMIVVVVVVGALLPRRHSAVRSAVIHQSADTIFATLRDFAGLPAWRSGLKSVELLPPRDGFVCFRETSGHGAIPYLLLAEEPGKRMVIRIADEALPFGGTWTFELSPAAGGTRVQITEEGEVKNAVFRFMARFVFGYTRTMETYLRDLGRKFAEDVVPAA